MDMKERLSLIRQQSAGEGYIKRDTVHWIKMQKWVVEGDGTGKMEIHGLRQSWSFF